MGDINNCFISPINRLFYTFKDKEINFLLESINHKNVLSILLILQTVIMNFLH